MILDAIKDFFKSPFLFNYILMLLYSGAGIRSLIDGKVWMCLYWFGGICIVVALTKMK